MTECSLYFKVDDCDSDLLFLTNSSPPSLVSSDRTLSDAVLSYWSCVGQAGLRPRRGSVLHRHPAAPMTPRACLETRTTGGAGKFQRYHEKRCLVNVIHSEMTFAAESTQFWSDLRGQPNCFIYLHL